MVAFSLLLALLQLSVSDAAFEGIKDKKGLPISKGRCPKFTPKETLDRDKVRSDMKLSYTF